MSESDNDIIITEEHLPRLLRVRVGSGYVYRWVALVSLLVYFFIFFPAGIYGSIKFFHKLAFADFKIPHSSILWQSGHWEKDPYNLRWQQPESLLIQSVPPGESLTTGIRWIELGIFSAELQKMVAQFADEEVVIGVRGYWITGYKSQDFITGTNNDTTLININYNRGHLKPYVPMFKDWLNKQELVTSGRYKVELSGIVQLQSALKHSVLPDMGTIDAVSIPLGLILFCIAARSILAVVLPVSVILLSVTTGLGLGQLLKMEMRITGFAPELMGVIVIALSIDFSLFFMTRLREIHTMQKALLQLKIETARPNNESFGEYTSPYSDQANPLHQSDDPCPPAIVWVAYKKVAHNIVISALAIALAFGGLAFIKADFVRSIALVCMFGTLMTLCSSMVFIPMMGYFLYPFCFENRLQRAIGDLCDTVVELVTTPCKRRNSAEDGGNSDDTLQTAFTREEADAVQHAHSPDRHFKLSPTQQRAEHSDFHRRLAIFSFDYPLIVIFGALVLIAPFIYVLFAGFSYNQSYLSSSPYNIKAWRDYVHIENTFGNVGDSPLYITFNTYDAPDGNKTAILQEQFWPLYVDTVKRGLAQSAFGVTLKDIDAICIFRNQLITWDQSLKLRNCTTNSTLEEQIACDEYAEVMKFTLTYGYRSERYEKDMQKQSVVAFRPTRGETFGENGASYLTALHHVMNGVRGTELYKSYGSTMWVGYKGPNDWSWWVMNQVMKEFVVVLAITFSVLFAAILALFRSLFFALKMVITVAYSVSMSFGLVTLLFHYSWLDALWYPLKEIDGYFWLIVILGFTVSCVVALDYDVFLIIRILDFRVSHQMTDRESTIEALSRSSSTIAWAAIIMISAIGALVFANTIMLAQFGLTIALSVAIDAYLVRPLIVPALIALCPAPLLWFPRCLPAPREADPGSEGVQTS